MSTSASAARMHNPTHPGKLLRELFMKPLGLTIIAVAEALGITRKHIAAIVNERAPVTPAMALRLAEAFSNRAEFWLNLQTQHDLWIEGKKARPKIKPLKAAA